MLRDNVTCDFTHPRAYLRNKWITLSHPFSCVGYKTVIAVDTSPRSLFIIVECVLQAYTVCRYVSQNDVTSLRWWSGLTRHTPDELHFLRISVEAGIWIVYYINVCSIQSRIERVSANKHEWTTHFRQCSLKQIVHSHSSNAHLVKIREIHAISSSLYYSNKIIAQK